MTATEGLMIKLTTEAVVGVAATFRAPALASPLPAGFTPQPGEWAAEEKYDGHRLVVTVEHDSPDHARFTAWSRYGTERALPQQVRDAVYELPTGTYDGELLVPGHRSYGVTELANADRLVYVVFDVLELDGADLTAQIYRVRRSILTDVIQATRSSVQLAETWSVSSTDDVVRLATDVWDRGGEGLILKRLTSTYAVGKRTRDWLKVKAVRSAVLTVVGFTAGKLGPYATVRLRDADGNETTVKTLNNRELGRLAAAPEQFLGKQLRIEYQERTPDGSYRHPRWDRWEEE